MTRVGNLRDLDIVELIENLNRGASVKGWQRKSSPEMIRIESFEIPEKQVS